MTTTTTTPPIPATSPDATPPDRTTARREIVRFVGLQALLGLAMNAVAASQDVDVLHIEDASALGQAATYGAALTPLVAALVARLSTTGTLRGWGFRRVRPGTLALAWAIGLVPVLLAYSGVWLSGAGRFDGTGAVQETLRSGLLAATVLVLPYVLLAVAEDVGWRGLLVTRLAQVARPSTVYLVSGVFWSLSHVGLILFLGGTPDGVSPLYAAAMFTIGATALGSILAAMQLRWGLWPGVLTHATVNAVLYHFADPATSPSGSGTGWIATETGLAYPLAMVVTALVLLRWCGLAAGHQSRTSGLSDPS